MENSLPDFFHPLIRQWFGEQLGIPTETQSRAWPAIARGEHVLVTAPTGTGKTMTAFLWALNQLLTGAWPGEGIRVLYVSPLKALNNDIQRNLLTPLAQLRERFLATDEPCFPVRVLTRSGDTPAAERQRMLRRPPEILITTPESLNLLVSAHRSREVLKGIRTVIMDEIHAVADNKRGTHLLSAVERLVLLSGEFQRIALSATLKPAEPVAAFVGGFTMNDAAGDPQYRARSVTLVQAYHTKRYSLSICFPPDAREKIRDDSWWPALIDSFREAIKAHTSTLFFANSRRMTEKVTRLLNESTARPLAWAHHGSLSREIRLAVEQKMKQGQLQAIVATNSLELGIDIGDLDQVLLIQTPPSVSSAVQRIGRAGHGVGEVSRALLFPTHGRDFLDAAVVARGVLEQEIEPLTPVENPLDVLAQVIVAMCGVETWQVDTLYAVVRTCWSFHKLPRRSFDLVLSMLSGRYEETRIRELRPRITIDRVDGSVRSREGALRLVYFSGGTIPDRGQYVLRRSDSKARIGELDEEFVWERTIGETFSLGAQTWRIKKITHNDVEVTPVENRPGIIPFWRGDPRNRDYHYARQLRLFLETANERLGDTSFQTLLETDYCMRPAAAAELIRFLQDQRTATHCDLPHAGHIVIEHFDDPDNKSDSRQVLIHTLWGGRVNQPLALALEATWEERYGYPLQIMADNDALLVMLPHRFESRDLFTMLSTSNLEHLLRRRLEAGGFFGARFRENAGRALLLPRAMIGKRMPLWMNRLRAKKLLAAVSRFPDFPIVLETWRTCLQDEFDLPHLREMLDAVADGQIRISETTTSVPSPFAGGLIWQQINKYMYDDDRPLDAQGTSLSDELIRELALSPELRPSLDQDLVDGLESKLQRTAAGYPPLEDREIIDWVRERRLMSLPEWTAMLESIERDGGPAGGDISTRVAHRILRVCLPAAATEHVCALEQIPALLSVLGLQPKSLNPMPVAGEGGELPKQLDAYLVPGQDEADCEDFFAQWLSFYGPLPLSRLEAYWGAAFSSLRIALDNLVTRQTVVIGTLTRESDAIQVCDRENLERLLRMARRSRAPLLQPRPLEDLPLFLAQFQGITHRGEELETLQVRLEQLFGFPARAAAWEEYILPARVAHYRGYLLDHLLQSGVMVWFGCGEKRISFAFSEERTLFQDPRHKTKPGEGLPALFPATMGKYDFLQLASHAGLDTATAADRLWQAVWAGQASNDSLAALRRGLLAGFDAVKPAEERKPSRGAFSRWQSTRPLPGNWFPLAVNDDGDDVLQHEELDRERVRQLLARYGVVFRELLARELPALQWRRLFRSLRLMELSGEIVSGQFFEGIPGLQFASQEAIRQLQKPLAADAVFWLNARDPAACCGLGLEGFQGMLPARLAGNWLVYRGQELALVAVRNGKKLRITLSAEDADLSRILDLFRELLARDFNRLKQIVVETINDQPARESPYYQQLQATGFLSGMHGLELRRSYH